MKKNLFWKIMAILFFLWLCVWLWNSSIYISHPSGSIPMKFNKLTGTAWILTEHNWQKFNEEMEENRN